MEIKALGGCCKKSMQNYENAKQAAKLCNISEEVINVTDYNEIAKLGVMSTPGIAINGKAVAWGKLSTVSEIVNYIKNMQN
ncbi:MAG: thioredoxin family protein [Bacilli bacterium]